MPSLAKGSNVFHAGEDALDVLGDAAEGDRAEGDAESFEGVWDGDSVSIVYLLCVFPLTCMRHSRLQPPP